MAIKGLIASVLVNAILGWLWLDARDDLASEIERCNTDKMEAIAEARRVTADAERRAAQRRIAELEQLAADRENALVSARRVAESANSEAAQAQTRIRELELEADFDEDDLPDSTECLNVFVPSRVLYPESCSGPLSGGSGDGQACAGAEGINPDNPAFAVITYADMARILIRDRASLKACNANLEAIANLEEPE